MFQNIDVIPSYAIKVFLFGDIAMFRRPNIMLIFSEGFFTPNCLYILGSTSHKLMLNLTWLRQTSVVYQDFNNTRF